MDMLKEVFRLFGRQTTQRLLGEIIQNKPQFARAAHMFPQIMSIDDTMRELNAHDLATNQRELTAAWTGLMEAMGSAGVPVAIMALHGVTAGIQMLTDAAVAHPDAAAGLLAVAEALSALLAVGGALGVAAFALRGFGSALGLFRVGAPAALGLETLGAGGAAGVRDGRWRGRGGRGRCLLRLPKLERPEPEGGHHYRACEPARLTDDRQPRHAGPRLAARPAARADVRGYAAATCQCGGERHPDRANRATCIWTGGRSAPSWRRGWPRRPPARPPARRSRVCARHSGCPPSCRLCSNPRRTKMSDVLKMLNLVQHHVPAVPLPPASTVADLAPGAGLMEAVAGRARAMDALPRLLREAAAASLAGGMIAASGREHTVAKARWCSGRCWRGWRGTGNGRRVAETIWQSQDGGCAGIA